MPPRRIGSIIDSRFECKIDLLFHKMPCVLSSAAAGQGSAGDSRTRSSEGQELDLVSSEAGDVDVSGMVANSLIQILISRTNSIHISLHATERNMLCFCCALDVCVHLITSLCNFVK